MNIFNVLNTMQLKILGLPHRPPHIASVCGSLWQFVTVTICILFNKKALVIYCFTRACDFTAAGI
jgi:hypothetical protein